MKTFFVYILASQKNGTLYVGMTSDLMRRISEHKANLYSGFTAQYGVHHLVYFEEAPDALSAIQREKRLKSWKRAWKIELIERHDPSWSDLSENFSGFLLPQE